MRVYAFILFALLSHDIIAQENPSMKYFLSTGYGFTMNFSEPYIGAETDNMLMAVQTDYYWKILSAGYFFSSNWGMEVSVYKYLTNERRNVDQMMNNYFIENYPEYYLVSSRPITHENLNSFSDAPVVSLIGLVYKLENQRFIALASLRIGMKEYSMNPGGAGLKRKDANDILEVEYSIDGGRTYSNIAREVISPSLALGYSFSNRVKVLFEATYMYSPMDITVRKTERNTLTEEITTSHFHYNSPFQHLNFGVAFMYAFGERK